MTAAAPTVSLPGGRKARYPTDRLVHELIEDQASARPDKPAVVMGDEVLTFAELNRRANQLAAYLRTAGAAAEIRIAAGLRRCPEAVVGLLGIVKAGAAPVLIDPAAPEGRLAFMATDSGARTVVTMSGPRGLSPAGLQALVDQGLRPVLLDRDGPAIGDQPLTGRPVELTLDNAAHVTYTSGSTGEPKGVVARHGSVLQCVHWAHEAFAMSAHDRATWVSAPGFGISLVNELWPALAAGCPVHLPDDETLLFPGRLRNWLVRHEITVVHLVRTLAEPLYHLDWPRECSLRLLLTTGERFERRPPAGLPFEVVVTYGSTETTHITSSYDRAARTRAAPETAGPEGRRSTPPAGWPVANVSVHLLGERLEPVPAGATGEVHVAGAGLARGYLEDPALTAARWLPDPFAAVPGSRMYRTGDLGRLRADGSLEVVGRTDRQIKIRGKRGNLDEVEATLRRCAGVGDAAVTAWGEDSSVRLAAYVTGVDRAGVPALYRALKAELPDHLLPADFVLVDALPQTPTGKIDRRALPPPRRSRAAAASALEAPVGALERALVELWRELLDLEEVGVRDDFFDLGGHSLLAVELVTAVEQRWGKRIDLRTFSVAPTIDALAALVEGRSQPAGIGPWLVRPAPRPNAAVRLVCFPFAGGGPSAFAGWAQQAPAGLELVCVQAPGRGPRLAEVPVDRLEELVAALGTALAPELEEPFAFFGHSLGALVAFELARWLRREGRPDPIRLFVAGRAAPQLPGEARAHQLDDEPFVRYLRGLGGTPEELLADQRMLRLVLPSLRADFAMDETSPYAAEPPLACPIDAFGGTDDAEVTEEELRAWRSQTSLGFSCTMLPGDHFFPFSAPGHILGLLAAALGLPPPPPGSATSGDGRP